MKKSIEIFCLILLALLIAPAAATTLYVDDDGGEGIYTNIGDAVAAAKEGDTIFVRAGIYPTFGTKSNITIIGEGADLVTVDYNENSFQISDTGLTVKGFTILKVASMPIYGSDNTIKDCIIDGITASTGIDIRGLNCTFENNSIQNVASLRTGVDLKGASPRIVNNTFTNISSTNCALYIRKEATNATIENNLFEKCMGSRALTLQETTGCTIANNTFKDNTGDAIRIWKAEATNNTITRNTFTQNGGIIYWREAGDNNQIFLNTFTDNKGAFTIHDGTVAPTLTHWNSTTPLTYTYNDTTHTGYLGNFWSDYEDTDEDGDGVIDDPYELPDGLGTDHAPLNATHDAYVPVAPPEPKTRYVDDDGGDGIYTTISDAVAASNAGDTVVVRDGAYTENVLVDKHLVIHTENGAGAVTVTAASTDKPVFDVDADGVTVEGFAVRGPTDDHVAGIEIVGFDDCIVRKNDCAGCYNGIHLGGDVTYGQAEGNTVEENSCHENTRRGISLRDSVTDNLVFNNTCEKNGEAEICIKDTPKDNIIWANAFLGPVEIKYANTYHSPDEVTYTYLGGEYTGYVGNYYSGYTGIDGDTNGIGDTPISFGTYTDDYPMMGEWQNGEIISTVPVLATVAVTPADAELEEKETLQFSAAGYDDTGEAMEDLVFTWTSSNTTVGSVNATGSFEALAGGTTTVTAESDGVQGTANVTVLALADLPKIRIVKYAEDGRTVVDETTVTVRWMKKNLDVYGGDNGVELHFQGPVFSDEWNETHPGEPYDFWDPEETVNANPGKINEVVKGTSLRDLCDLVGGAEEGNEIKLTATDGYSGSLPYTSVYEPAARQGEAIIAWWNQDKGDVPAYRDGPRLFFMAPDGIFGNWDMHECLPEWCWHYYDKMPAVAGISVAKVDTIEIMPEPRQDWSLTLTGAIDEEIGRPYYEHGVECSNSIHRAEWTDGGQTWSGLALWLLCGWVDDGQSHGAGAYRDDLADAGYTVVLTDYGPDGIEGTADDQTVEFASADVKRNDDIILANEIDGMPLAEGDWPLRLVGDGVPADKRLGGIDAIRLLGLPGSDGDMTLILCKGWNFVSVPRTLAPGNDTVALFENVDCAGHSIFGYDGTDGWEVLKTSAPIKPLDGIWIYSNTTATVALTFDSLKPTTAPTKALVSGWNAIGFSDVEPAPAKDALASVKDAWAILIGLDAEEQAYAPSIINSGSGSHSDERDLNPGEGYWVFMRTGGTLAAISI